MNLRKKIFWGTFFTAALMAALVLGAAVYWYQNSPRRDLLRSTVRSSVDEAKNSQSARRFRDVARRLLRKARTQLRRDPYALDEMSRVAVRDADGLACPDVKLDTYAGDAVGYTRPITVNPHFKERLGRFESIAAEVGREVYGRPPSRVIHFGAYNCRSLRHKKTVLSEHAFGNALDVAGFEFDEVPADERAKFGEFGAAFEVSVLAHWNAQEGQGGRHALFLKQLVLRLERDRVFRGMLVPPAPGHHDHLHLDMGWWIYLNGDPSIEAS